MSPKTEPPEKPKPAKPDDIEEKFDEELDEAGEESFPASDPPAVGDYRR